MRVRTAELRSLLLWPEQQDFLQPGQVPEPAQAAVAQRLQVSARVVAEPEQVQLPEPERQAEQEPTPGAAAEVLRLPALFLVLFQPGAAEVVVLRLPVPFPVLFQLGAAEVAVLPLHV